MSLPLSKLAALVSPDDSIDIAWRKVSSKSKTVSHPGLAIILSPDNVLEGILTDGDIRRAYANDTNFNSSVRSIMNSDPIVLSHNTPRDQIIAEVNRLLRKSARIKHTDYIRHILLLNDSGVLVDILDYYQLLEAQLVPQKRVAVFGMGYVGITLAVSLANRGHYVCGIDILPDLITQLSQGDPHVHEPGLRDMLQATLLREQISFASTIDSDHYDVYIISVGTPVHHHSKPDLSALLCVVQSIGTKLSRGDLVLLRSTVPVQTTRELIIPLLEKLSGLSPGTDFSIAFSPERTIEGNALQEIRNLPQIVGGYTPSCTRIASQFWSTLTPSVVQVSSLEAAELVKLANNTFRDLSFAFANELALVADQSNVNAFDLIRAANDGYPRNPIPFPSPGVGGYCLTKDPLLFTYSPFGQRNAGSLAILGREINTSASLYPSTVLDRYCAVNSLSLSSLSVLFIGIAFKGDPPTTDVRGSTSIDLYHELLPKVSTIFGWDAVIPADEIADIGFTKVSSLQAAIQSVDAILILNNHPDNINSASFIKPSRAQLIFDGWNQLDCSEIEKIPGLTYSTMGYMTSP